MQPKRLDKLRDVLSHVVIMKAIGFAALAVAAAVDSVYLAASGQQGRDALQFSMILAVAMNQYDRAAPPCFFVKEFYAIDGDKHCATSFPISCIIMEDGEGVKAGGSPARPGIFQKGHFKTGQTMLY